MVTPLLTNRTEIKLDTAMQSIYDETRKRKFAKPQTDISISDNQKIGNNLTTCKLLLNSFLKARRDCLLTSSEGD
jgi:hypothetical protein